MLSAMYAARAGSSLSGALGQNILRAHHIVTSPLGILQQTMLLAELMEYYVIVFGWTLM